MSCSPASSVSWVAGLFSTCLFCFSLLSVLCWQHLAVVVVSVA